MAALVDIDSFDCSDLSDLSENSLFGEDILNLDINELDFDVLSNSPMSSIRTLDQEQFFSALVPVLAPVLPLKSSSQGPVSKFKPAVRTGSKKMRSKQSMKKTIINSSKGPNMSRRAQNSILCAFPTFDKCDSLVFLPSSITRLLNSSDFSGIADLLSVHTSKDCVVNIKGLEVDVGGFVHLYELTGDLYPDTVTCVHTTKVVDNTIQATMFTKFTDSPAIFNGLYKSMQEDRLYKQLCIEPRRIDRYRRKILPNNRSQSDIDLILSPAELEADLIVYANLNVNFTFDNFTRKINQIEYIFDLQSMIVV